ISVALTGTAPWSITYTNGSTPVTVSGITTSPYIFQVSPVTNTTYTITAVSDANCTGTFSGSAVITVNPVPSCSIAGTNTICSGTTNSYASTVTPSGGTVTHLWSVVLGGATISGSTTGSTVNIISPTVCTTSTFTVQDNVSRNGCTSSCTYNVTVNPPAVPTFTTTPTNTTVACGAIPPVSSLSYTNSGSGTCLISGSVTSTQTAAPGPCGGNVTDTWTFTDACNRTITQTRVITVSPAPPAVFAAAPPITVACGAAVTSNLTYTN